ncbi:MAG: hypothetical protein QOC78_1768 [Solirubrobacteraceae bacterium]|nr:hypothetical protein [Solirubrobacteraceae bacterium]
MATNPPVEDRRDRFQAFVQWCADNIHGDEKGQAQVFLDRLFQAFGHGGVFEAGATLEHRIKAKSRNGTAFADLTWKPRVLIEMKKRGEDLAKHYRQAFDYWLDLVPDRPQFVVLCNFDELWVYDLNHQLEEPLDKVAVVDLPNQWEALAFLLPAPEKPRFENDLVQLTRDSAGAVSGVFNALLTRGIDRAVAQRFTLQCVMAMFSEDVGLLPRHSFSAALDDSLSGGSAYDLVFGLFRAMNEKGVTAGGRYEGTPYFNGGLFREVQPFELDTDEVERLKAASEANWGEVRPAIFGTLFEKSLEHGERRAQGAHFTSETDILKVVRPVMVRPWEQRIEQATTLAELAQVENDLLQHRVLDPACGCGNFLYVAYRELRRLENQLQHKIVQRRRSEGAGDQQRLSFVSTSQFFGIDFNAFAVEIAKVTLMLARKLAAEEFHDEPNVLPLDDLDSNFSAADALTVKWPSYDTCIGNPPYLGRRWIAPRRGADYAAWLLDEYPEVGGVADYVSYWFRLAHDGLPEGGRAGLVGTTSIRQGATREATLDYIADNGGVIYDAVSSQAWDGEAKLRVSIVNWAKGLDPEPKTLWLADGTVKVELPRIPGSLAPELDLGLAPKLQTNKKPKLSFQGQTPGRPGFYRTPEEARALVANDASSAEVLFPYLIGDELNSDGQPTRFIIDIPSEDAIEARRWHAVYDHLKATVLPMREAEAAQEAADNAELAKQRPNARLNWHHRGFLSRWWRHSYRRDDMLTVIEQLPRFIALSRVAVESRQSVYHFVSPAIRPGDRLQVFALDDDYSFGILHSTFHRLWFEGTGSRQGKGKGVTYATKTWQTFPWPQAPTEETVTGVVDVVERLLDFRESKVTAGTPLITLYDTLREPGKNPLRDLHDELDAAVGAAYGFNTEDDPRAQLLALNASIAAEEQAGRTARGPGTAGLAGTRRTSYRIDPAVQL